MIEVKELHKHYGDIKAVDGISFEVKKGEVLGFLGPNGAGKSTTMKIITGFIPPTSGTVVVGGKDILTDSIAVREQIGYLPESAPSYAEMTVEEYLEFIAEVRGFTGSERDKRVDAAVERTSLEEVRRQIIDTLSKGYKQRVCFGQALLHNPPVLILDEPTDGLDPNQKHQMRQVIQQMGQEKTIILSTHILEEMEAVCSRAIIISNGKMVVDGTPDELAAMSPHHNAVTIRAAEDGKAEGKALVEKLQKIKGVAKVDHQPAKGKEPAAYCLFPEEKQVILPEVTKYLEKNKVAFQEVYVEKGRVDEVFRSVTKAP